VGDIQAEGDSPPYVQPEKIRLKLGRQQWDEAGRISGLNQHTHILRKEIENDSGCNNDKQINKRPPFANPVVSLLYLVHGLLLSSVAQRLA
jgi:hypothetical protein